VLDSAAALFDTVREFQDETERERCIPRPLVDQLREAGLHRMLLPRSLGGEELDLPTCFRVVELMAEADGSVGWNLMNNSVIKLTSLAFSDECVEELFGPSPDHVIAGTLVPGGGTGTQLAGGYRVSGRWRFGSGCREARWMIGNFDLVGDDGARVRPDGVFRVAFPIDDVTIIDTWDMTGMRGTGSHDWAVTDVFVPEHRVLFVPGRVTFNQWHERWPGTLYALPVHSIIGPHHSLMATGIACAGIDALAELAGAKVPRGRQGAGLLRDQPQVQDWIARAEGHLGGGRLYREAMVEDVWCTVDRGETPTLEQVARCRLAGSFAADSARAAMDIVFRAGGTTSTIRTHRIAHCWRDLQVVGQAGAVSPDWYPVVGRALLGLEPGPRLTTL
jgi:alkylation response protein AidB-like acyl-CoA dehydrogenase